MEKTAVEVAIDNIYHSITSIEAQMGVLVRLDKKVAVQETQLKHNDDDHSRIEEAYKRIEKSIEGHVKTRDTKFDALETNVKLISDNLSKVKAAPGHVVLKIVYTVVGAVLVAAIIGVWDSKSTTPPVIIKIDASAIREAMKEPVK